MGGMHALEWAVGLPDRVERVGILSAPPVNTADQIALNSVQLEAIRIDPRFQSGEYYDADDGDGPNRGLALARRMALLNYRSPTELNQRFQRSLAVAASARSATADASPSSPTSTSTATGSRAASTRTPTSPSSTR